MTESDEVSRSEAANTAPSRRYDEDDLLPISALQHLLFCERQCALIHVEQLWQENRLTAEGRVLHERVDHGPDETRGDLRVVRSLPLRSYQLGVTGKADVVEFVGEGVVRPVEYKRGKKKTNDSDRVQLCAQAMCLEEMLSVAIEQGALFYGTPRRRTEVVFDAALRERTTLAAERLHALLRSGRTPPAIREPKCASCSLVDLCLPADPHAHRSAQRFTDRALGGSLRATTESMTDPSADDSAPMPI